MSELPTDVNMLLTMGQLNYSIQLALGIPRRHFSIKGHLKEKRYKYKLK